MKNVIYSKIRFARAVHRNKFTCEYNGCGMTEKDNQVNRVIVIGAGPAGLTAAYELLRNNPGQYQVTVFEESAIAGGISRTVEYAGGRMDMGGHRFFSKDERVMEWWKNMMPLQGEPSRDDILTGTHKDLEPSGPDPEHSDIVMLLRNRISRIFTMQRFFSYPISLKLETFKAMGFVKTIQAGCSYLFSLVHKLPESSLENFYINRFGKKLYSMFFEKYTEKVWGRPPSQISADWGSQRVKGLSVTKIISENLRKLLPQSDRNPAEVETSLIESFWYPKFGPGQLWELTADEIEKMGGQVCRNCRVSGLTIRDGAVKSISYEEGGETKSSEGDIFISSMPLKDLIAGIDGSVPDDVAVIADGLPYRDFVTVGLEISELKLKNQTKIITPYDRIPDCWIYMQDEGVKVGRLQIFNNWSPYMVNDFEHCLNIGLEYFCTEGDEMWSMPDDEFISFAISELEGVGMLDPSKVRNRHIERVRKAYPSYFDTYAQIDRLIEWLNGIDNLYCIGRNGQHRYNNMDHSMATSFEAVAAITTGDHDKSRIWNVNTEKSYHEEK